MTLIQDGNQIESKMVKTGVLDTFIPKDWADANNTTADAYEGYLPLQTLNKVFMYNCVGEKSYDNVWDFVAEGEHGLFMDIDSEIVGKNFLYMLTRDDYSTMLKTAFEALPAEEQAYFQPTIDAMAADAANLGLTENAKYGLAWIKLWVGSYNAQTDDGRFAIPWFPIPPRISSAFWFTPSSAPLRNPPLFPRTTSRLQPIRMATPVSAAMATAITCLLPITAPCPGLPAPLSPT